MQNNVYGTFILESELRSFHCIPLKKNHNQPDKEVQRQSTLMEGLSDIKLDFRPAERSQSSTLPTAVPEPMR